MNTVKSFASPKGKSKLTINKETAYYLAAPEEDKAEKRDDAVKAPPSTYCP